MSEDEDDNDYKHCGWNFQHQGEQKLYVYLAVLIMMVM